MFTNSSSSSRARRNGTLGPARNRNLIDFHEIDRGGHFAACEQPELFASELRAAFRSQRATSPVKSRAGRPKMRGVSGFTRVLERY